MNYVVFYDIMRRIFRSRQGARNTDARSVLMVREHGGMGSNAVWDEKDKHIGERD